MELLGIINGVLSVIDIAGGVRLILLSKRYEIPQLMIAGAFLILFAFIAPSFGEVRDIVINVAMAYIGWSNLIVNAAFDNWS